MDKLGKPGFKTLFVHCIYQGDIFQHLQPLLRGFGWAFVALSVRSVRSDCKVWSHQQKRQGQFKMSRMLLNVVILL